MPQLNLEKLTFWRIAVSVAITMLTLLSGTVARAQDAEDLTAVSSVSAGSSLQKMDRAGGLSQPELDSRIMRAATNIARGLLWPFNRDCPPPGVTNPDTAIRFTVRYRAKTGN